MKTAFIIFTLFLSTISNCFSQQKYILLTNKTNGKERKIKQDTRVLIILNDDEVLKGELNILNDSIIKINRATINMNQIEILKRRSLISTITDIIIISGGTLITTAGVTVFVAGITQGGFGPIASIVFGIPVTALGSGIITSGIIFLTKNRKYNKEKWSMKIIS